MKRRTGFYLAGDFSHRKAGFMFLPIGMKPFEIDSIEGTITPKGIQTCGKHHYVWNEEWYFFEGKKIKELESDVDLIDEVNDIWMDWCKKHRRKVDTILDKSLVRKVVR
jgi:hypothetical protein